MARADWEARYPGFGFLSAGDAGGVAEALARAGVKLAGPLVVEKAGEGNMNLVLRARSPEGASVIVKQSRPWVEKYDFIDAPWDRAVLESRFYAAVAGLPGVAGRMPRVLGFDGEGRVLVLEDLGPAADMTGVYRGEVPAAGVMGDLGRFLAALHRGTRGDEGGAGFDAETARISREMRGLNHAHVYEIPLADPPAVDLEAIEVGLGKAAGVLRGDEAFRDAVAATGDRYLSDGECLLHGDFFPGSWVMARGRVWVIDPEFAYFGDPEFDLGVAAAHVALAGMSRDVLEGFLGAYVAGGGESVDGGLLARYAGVEVMRRLIGVAQLPLGRLDRAALLERARQCVVRAEVEALWA